MQYKILIVIISLLFTGTLLSACDKATKEDPKGLYDRALFDQQMIKQGRQLYLKNCMVCHGFNAEGATDWRKRDTEGRLPPPPLNGTGHAWHHPRLVLVDTIREGTARLGGTMPAWKNKLSDDEIDSIIMWFQTQWPDQLYAAWVDRDRQSKQAK